MASRMVEGVDGASSRYRIIFVWFSKTICAKYSLNQIKLNNTKHKHHDNLKFHFFHFNSFCRVNVPLLPKMALFLRRLQQRSRSAMWRKASRLRRGWLDVLPAPPREPWVEVDAVMQFLAPKKRLLKRLNKNEKCGGVVGLDWWLVTGWVHVVYVVSSKKCHVYIVPANCTFTNDSATPMAYDVNSGRKQLFQPQ